MRTSETHTEVFKALVRVQAEIRNPANSANNPFFKSRYAPLDEILEMVRPILSRNGLAVIQNISGDGSSAAVTTMLVHVSGEYVESDAFAIVPAKLDAQGLGGATTYARRYTLTAMLGIAGANEDDDGNVATQGAKMAPKAMVPPKPNAVMCPRCGTAGSFVRESEYEGKRVMVFRCGNCKSMFRIPV